MKQKFAYALVVGGALVLTGCGKKLTAFQSDYFTVNPSPLEVVGNNVPATVTARIPGNFFLKNAEVTVTPYLEFNGTEVAAQSYTFQGENVRGNNPVVNYEYGGTVSIPVNYVYQPEMSNSALTLAFDVKQGGKQYVLPRVKVADGVIATATLADVATVTPAITADKFQRIINEQYAADITFLINQANVRQGQIKSEDILALHEQLRLADADSSRVIEGINISSYASPEGAVDFNTRLAEQREQNTSTYLRGQLKRDKITEFGELTAQFTAEDWEGFQSLVAASDIQDKELILSVLSMYKDPEEREREIRNLSTIFDQLADEILPQLRYSRITASINVIGKSDEEIAALYATNPSALNVDELLYCATLTDNIDEKTAIYTTATRIYPEDYRTFNNLGMCQYIAKNYDAAEASFNKAARINGNSEEVKMNLGLLSMLENDYSEANQLFGEAAGVEALNDALGVYYLETGDNNAAVKAFGNSKTNNAALAQILTKDYSKAKSTLSAINNPDATTYYLMAVLGARTNNEQMVFSNLRQAIKLDASFAEKAKNDMEFAGLDLSAL